MGGNPTPAGESVPAVDLRLSLNTSVAAGGILFLDDPLPSDHVLCTGACGVNGVGGAGLTFSSPSAPENNGQRVPNVFQGRQVGGNSVEWFDIPIDPPGTVGSRIIRIRNVRANASAVPPGHSIMGP